MAGRTAQSNCSAIAGLPGAWENRQGFALSYDSLAKSVQKQVPELMARYKARSIEFRIEVKDGKTVLKVIPRI